MRLPALGHCACSAIVSAALSVSTTSLAQDETPAQVAESLFREGRDAVKKGDYAVACPKFAESQRLDPANGTLLNLALCEEGWGRLADARAHLRTLLGAPDLDEKRRAIATEHLRSIDQRESQLTPAPAKPPPEKPAVLAPLPKSANAHEETPTTAASPNAAAYLLGGLGVLSLTTCAVTGILVIERSDTVNAHCPNKLCDAEGLAAASSGRTLSAVSTAAFVAGVVLTGLSIYVLVQSGDRPKRSAIVVNAGPQGALAGWVQPF